MVTTAKGPLPSRHTPAWLTIQRRHALTPLLGAALLVLLAFLTTGGVLSQAPNQAPNSWVDAALILAGGGAIAALVIRRSEGGGTLSFGLFGAVTVLGALSIAWSVAPDQSWEESGRAVAYLAAFGIALVYGRLSRARVSSRGAVLAITLAALALSVWALAVKVLGLNLYDQPDYGPLLAPFSYWNATGVIGAMAIPGSLYLAAGRDGRPLIRGLGVAGIAIGASVVALTYSRSALAAAVVGAALPLFFIPERRRAVLMLALGLLGALAAWIFADASPSLTADTSNSLYGGTSASINRTTAELALGAILLASVVVLTTAGALLSRYFDQAEHPPRRLALYDRGLLGLLALIPAAVVLWLLVNHRGPVGEISHIWHTLTTVYGSESGSGASRIGSLANSRALYWREALDVAGHHLLAGAGIGAFYPAYLHYHAALLGYAGQAVQHAHSYVMETLATLGLLGLALTAALFCAWWRDAIASVRRAPATELSPRWALIGIVIAFGVSSALDWTWFFPGVAVPGLLAAGWIAGVSRTPRSADAPLAVTGPARPVTAPPALVVEAKPRPLGARPGAILALTLVAIATLAVAWESLAPMRSTQSVTASLNAQEQLQGVTALADARTAISQDPLSATARERLADVYGALKEPARERAELVKATQVQPQNPQPFAALGGYLLCSRHQYAAAVSPLQRATMLDLTDSYLQTEMLAAAKAKRYPTATCASFQ